MDPTSAFERLGIPLGFSALFLWIIYQLGRNYLDRSQRHEDQLVGLQEKFQGAMQASVDRLSLSIDKLTLVAVNLERLSTVQAERCAVHFAALQHHSVQLTSLQRDLSSIMGRLGIPSAPEPLEEKPGAKPPN